MLVNMLLHLQTQEQMKKGHPSLMYALESALVKRPLGALSIGHKVVIPLSCATLL